MTIIGLWLLLIGAIAGKISESEQRRWQRVIYPIAGYMALTGFVLMCIGMSIFVWRVMP